MERYIGNSRFGKPAHSLLEELNVSIDFDKKLFAQDIAGSLAHVQMLAACGIISKNDEEEIGAGLLKIKADIEAGRFEFSLKLEDIHMNIEAALADYIGADKAGRLHTARSRNDQVALDFRLFIREALAELGSEIKILQKHLAVLALEHC